LPKELKYFYEDANKVKKARKRPGSSAGPNLVKRKVKKEVDIDKLVEVWLTF
jgi:hypothetical protein